MKLIQLNINEPILNVGSAPQLPHESLTTIPLPQPLMSVQRLISTVAIRFYYMPDIV